MADFTTTAQYREDLERRLNTHFDSSKSFGMSGKDLKKLNKSQQALYEKRMNSHYNKEWSTGARTGSYSKHESRYMTNLVQGGRENSFVDFNERKRNDYLRERGKFTPGTGVQTGAGFGLAGSFKTGKMDDFKSFLFDTPLVAKEASLNSLGFLTKQQKMQMATSGPLGKAMGALVPLSTMALIGSGMANGDDPYTIMQNQTMAAAGFTGGIAGMRLGGVMSPVSANGYIRGASRLAGFATGAVLAAGAAYGVTESIRDLTSADSKLGALMYDAPKRELLASYEQTQGTLTMRQRSLQQISSSVLNDRGFTLGNEASILKNVSL